MKQIGSWHFMEENGEGTETKIDKRKWDWGLAVGSAGPSRPLAGSRVPPGRLQPGSEASQSFVTTPCKTVCKFELKEHCFEIYHQ